MTPQAGLITTPHLYVFNTEGGCQVGQSSQHWTCFANRKANRINKLGLSSYKPNALYSRGLVLCTSVVTSSHLSHVVKKHIALLSWCWYFSHSFLFLYIIMIWKKGITLNMLLNATLRSVWHVKENDLCDFSWNPQM